MPEFYIIKISVFPFFGGGGEHVPPSPTPMAVSLLRNSSVNFLFVNPNVNGWLVFRGASVYLIQVFKNLFHMS